MIGVSDHAIERYVERIKEIDDNPKSYARVHRDMLISQIQKLFEYSEHIYTGKIGNNAERKFYVKDKWCIITDLEDTVVITIFVPTFQLPDDIEGAVRQSLINAIRNLSQQIADESTEFSKISEEVITESNNIASEIKVLQTSIDQLKLQQESLVHKKEVKQFDIKALKCQIDAYATKLFGNT